MFSEHCHTVHNVIHLGCLQVYTWELHGHIKATMDIDYATTVSVSTLPLSVLPFFNIEPLSALGHLYTCQVLARRSDKRQFKIQSLNFANEALAPPLTQTNFKRKSFKKSLVILVFLKFWKSNRDTLSEALFSRYKWSLSFELVESLLELQQAGLSRQTAISQWRSISVGFSFQKFSELNI